MLLLNKNEEKKGQLLILEELSIERDVLIGLLYHAFHTPSEDQFIFQLCLYQTVCSIQM